MESCRKFEKRKIEMSREEHPDGKEPIWGNPTLMECVGKGSFQLLGTGMVPPSNKRL
jgi:hypothetical protein